MTARKLLVPGYLLACLLLGGSTQSIWFNALLQLAAIGIIAWAAMSGAREPLPPIGRALGSLLAAGALLVLVTLVPLPPMLWSALPGHGWLRQGLAILGLAPGWQSISLSPYDSISALLPLLPPLAILAAMFLLRAYSREGIALALIVGAALSLALGVLQVRSPVDAQSQFYLQPEVNPGVPSGFFANPNHLATLLLIVLPFVAALFGSRETQRGRQQEQGRLLLGAAALALVIGGLIFNRSLAGLGLLVPVGLASALMLAGRRTKWSPLTISAAAVGVVLAVFVLGSQFTGAEMRGDAASSVSTRRDFLDTSLAVAGTYAPLGSGLGTFAKVYRVKENPHAIDMSAYVNHAHDDYVELLVELGIPGALLILLFLVWWGRAVLHMLRSPASDLYARAGAIGSAAVLLHSFVDYPLRNSAISTSFAACIALIVLGRKNARGETDLRPTRHVEIV